MDKKTEALKLALETLESDWDGCVNSPKGEAITAIREALAEESSGTEQPAQQQKPVAWVREHELPLAPGDAFSWVETFVHKTPLYTSPPASKPWIGLTKADKKEIERIAVYVDGAIHLTEAKLREKNT